VDLATQREIARKTLRFLDEGTTEMAPDLYEEPIDSYISGEVWRREIERVFARFPLFVGMSMDLPEAGSWLTREMVGTPLVLTRDDEGTVHAFLNSCRHRGVKVAVEASGWARRLTCPFHGWVYTPEGELVGIPFARGFEGMDRQGKSLAELPAAEVNGMLFAQLAPGPPIDVEDFLAGLGPDLGEFGFETWTAIAEPHIHHVKANWKTVFDGFCETYHFLVLHRDTAPHVYANVSVFEGFDRHGRMTTTNKVIDELRSRDEKEWFPLRDGAFNVNYRVFPSLSFSTIGSDRTEIFQVLPGGSPDDTVAIHFSYLRHQPATEAEREKALEDLRFACLTIVDNQDFRVNESTLPGIRHGAAPKTFTFGRNEPCAQYWHRQMSLAMEGR
jgi:phenylpropionate dioxygenase-like ring-hydroxylating dioxygenase large terminal subunit